MLGRTTMEDQINALFSKFGRVNEVFILRDGQGNSKGCAFVKMANKDEADIATLALNEIYQDPVTYQSSIPYCMNHPLEW
jgi:CUG-BP- and ETR3-like factor